MDKETDAILVVLIFVATILLCIAFMLGQDYGRSSRDDRGNLVKIECDLHRDNADVRELCIEQGYDR